PTPVAVEASAPVAVAPATTVTEAVPPRAASAHARRDPRLPAPGTVLTRGYRGAEVRVSVREDAFEYAGRTYRTLSAIAHEVTGSRWNGFLFFGLAKRAARSGRRR